MILENNMEDMLEVRKENVLKKERQKEKIKKEK